ALQKAFDRGAGNAEIVYFVFDVPYFEGYDLREVPLVSRRQLLQAMFQEKATEHVRFSTAFDADPASVLSSACRMNLEGVIAKRADSPYASRRTETWLKLKCQQRQEFVVAGYTDRSDGSKAMGSLLLGYYEKGKLRYAGRVGTGWSHKLAGELLGQLQAIRVDKAHFSDETIQRSHWQRRATGDEHWVKPQMVVEVAFAEWTPDGHIRHASFQGVREDKPASAIGRESAKAASKVKAAVEKPAAKAEPKAREKKVIASSRAAKSAATAKAGKGEGSKLTITHPERVIDGSTGLTKLDLVRYYEGIAEWLMPHLAKRPVALVRAPEGVEGQLFFQKHVEGDDLIVIPDAAEVLQFTQMNAVEFHTWNAQADKPDKPDRMIFDLDPGEGVSWPKVREAALVVRALLRELSLDCWLKTSGGKGLHVVVPLARRWDNDTCKAFSLAVVKHLAATLPKRFVAKSGPKNRVGKIFPDYLRNGEGQTTASAFSARSRPGLGVSMPIDWEELDEVKSGAHWTIANARDRMSFQKVDPWKDYWGSKQTLTKAMKLLDL
ncbi:MAG: DNA ligase D, partial [Burkholderiaceae bacterium]